MGTGPCDHVIFGLLVIGSQMYVDAAAPAELRGQAQGRAEEAGMKGCADGRFVM